MIKLIVLVIFGVVSGALYRLGGIGKPYNTKYRDFGVPIIALATMLYLKVEFSWQLVLSTVLLFGALTTYWKKINKFFGDTDENCHWYNWLVHGLICGLAYLPLYYIGVPLGNIIGN